MANPNHVHDDSLHVHNGQNIYADPEYNALFPGGVEPAFDPAAFYSPQTGPAPTWQQPATISRPASALGGPYEASNQFFARPYANSPLQYPDSHFRHGNINPYSQPPAVDPSLVSASTMRQPSYEMGIRNAIPTSASPSTIAPQALQNSLNVNTQMPRPSGQKASPSVQESTPKSTVQSYAYSQAAAQATVPAPVQPSVVMPKGELRGSFMEKKIDEVVKASKSVPLHYHVTIGIAPIELSLNKTTVPNYTARKSRREIQMLSSKDKTLLTRITKKSGKKAYSTLRAPRIRSGLETSSAQSPSGLRREFSDSGSETESSSESDYSSDEETPEPSPLPASRPEEPKQAVRYDVIKATWLPSRSSTKPDQIRVGLSDFWEVVRTIRDRWRADNAALKDAEEKKRVNELSLLRSRVESQRAMMDIALKTTIELGHPDIVHHLGEMKPFLLLLYQFLADRITSQDYNNGVIGIILDLLSRCSTLTNAKLDESKLSKVLSILSRKGNDKTKESVKQLWAKIAASPENKASPPALGKPGDSKDNTKAVQSTARSVDPPTGSKRPRPTDSAAGEPAKRVASGGLLNKPATSTVAKSATNGLKRPGEKATATPNAAPKPKPNPVVTKPSSFFSSLQAAPKRPGAQPVGKTGTQVKTANATNGKKAPPAAPMRSSAPAFSFAETMANLMKPKEPEVVAKPEEKRPPETPEEKAKRERKESRRALRVSFRPDATLVSVRYFSHDPEEEVGHDASMVRDAGDVGGEGRMFKQHKDQMEFDEEDDDLPREESYRDWVEPSVVDFSVIDIEERKKNYTKYGGGTAVPTCPEKEENERREADTLMVFYTHQSDIPPSPREPLEAPEEAPAKPVIEFGKPPDNILERAAALTPAPVQPPEQNLAALFNMMAQPQQTQQQPTPSTSQLESIFAQFSKPAQPAPAPQQAPTTDLFSILGALQQPQGQQAPPMPQYPPPFAIQHPAQAAVPDVNALLAALYTPNQQNAAPAMPFNMPFNFANMGQQPQGQPQHQSQQQSQAGIYENEERKRWRESGGVEAAPERDHGSGSSFKKHKGKFRGGDGGKGAGYKPHKVQPCRFFQEGKCAKGDQCTYIHDQSEVGRR